MAWSTSMIEARASDKLIETFGHIQGISLPVSLDKIVNHFGLTVEFGEFASANISGAYRKSDKRIFVSQDDQYYRQAFTIAHELGHFFLHEDKEDEVFLRQFSIEPDAETDEVEVEANKFAAALLMPRELVEQYWPRHSANDIAARFGISPSAATWRLRTLGMLES